MKKVEFNCENCGSSIVATVGDKLPEDVKKELTKDIMTNQDNECPFCDKIVIVTVFDE